MIQKGVDVFAGLESVDAAGQMDLTGDVQKVGRAIVTERERLRDFHQIAHHLSEPIR